jgi:large subunit ribosomal protein L7/L12
MKVTLKKASANFGANKLKEALEQVDEVLATPGAKPLRDEALALRNRIRGLNQTIKDNYTGEAEVSDFTTFFSISCGITALLVFWLAFHFSFFFSLPLGIAVWVIVIYAGEIFPGNNLYAHDGSFNATSVLAGIGSALTLMVFLKLLGLASIWSFLIGLNIGLIVGFNVGKILMRVCPVLEPLEIGPPPDTPQVTGHAPPQSTILPPTIQQTLPPVQPSKPEVPANNVEPDSRIHCTKCGNKLNKGAKFCPVCGKSTSTSPSENDAETIVVSSTNVTSNVVSGKPDFVNVDCNKGTWDLILVSYGYDRIRFMSEIRDMTGCTPAQAKWILESMPVKLLEGVSESDAEYYKKYLSKLGVKVKIENHPVAITLLKPASPGSGSVALQETSGQTWDFILDDCGNSKIGVIKIIRDITGCGLADGKRMADSAPVLLMEGISINDAKMFESKFKSLGATVQIKEHTGSLNTGKRYTTQEKPRTYNLVLVEYGYDRVGVMSEIRKVTGCAVGEAKRLIDSAPITLLRDISEDDAQKYKTSLEIWGAQVRIDPL